MALREIGFQISALDLADCLACGEREGLWPRRSKKTGRIIVRCIECGWNRSVARLYAQKMFSDPVPNGPKKAAAAFRIAERHDGLKTGIRVPNYGRLQKDLRPHEVAYLDGLAEAIRCHWLGRGDRCSPYSRKYASAVSGITEGEAHKAERRFLRRGLVEVVGHLEARGDRRPANLYAIFGMTFPEPPGAGEA